MPIVASDGRVLGHLALRHKQPLGDEVLVDRVYRIFLARAAAEINGCRRWGAWRGGCGRRTAGCRGRTGVGGEPWTAGGTRRVPVLDFRGMSAAVRHLPAFAGPMTARPTELWTS